MLRLGLLAFRRVLPAWLGIGLLFLLVLAARASRGVPVLAADAEALVSLRALARQNVWSVLLVLAPLFFLCSARLGTHAETLWLAPTPLARPLLALVLGAGAALACLVATGLTALVSESTLERAPEAWRRTGTSPSPTALLLEEQRALRWSIPAPNAGERLRLWTTIAIGSGPAVTARFTARAGARTSVREERVSGRTALELTPPPGASGSLELELERMGEGALLVLPPDALETLTPIANESLAAWELATRTSAMLVAGCLVALGLGRILRPALAAGLVLALVLFSWSSPWAERWIPCADLPRAWRELSEGLVPGAMHPASMAGTLVLAALGLALHAGHPVTRSGRHT